MAFEPSAYDRLRKKTDRIKDDSALGLTQEERLDLLQMVHEFEIASTELEMQNEQLREVSRDLEESRNEYYDLYESAPVAFITLSRKGIIQRANAMARQMLEAADQPIIGVGFSRFVLPEDWNIFFDALKTVIHQQTTSFELRLAGDTPKQVHVHFQAVTRSDPDRPLRHWQLAMFDISEHRQKDRQLQRLHEQLEMAAHAAELGVWNYDPATRTAIWNAQLYRLLGLEPREGPESVERFFEFIHPDDRSDDIASMAAVTHRGGDQINKEFRIIRADGEVRWLASRGRVYRDCKGAISHVSGINFDITTRKRIEETARLVQLQLAAQLAETERVNEELSQYAYVVSHDLKEPLRALHNYAAFLYEDLSGSLTGEQKTYLEGLQTAAQQGNALIDDLLNFSRLERVTMEKTPADVVDIVKEIQAIIDPPPEVKIRLAPQWPEFKIDRTLLKQILQNLIANGIKFNRRPDKHIDIGWRPSSDNAIDIFVKDDGIGIDAQYFSQIFRIFQRLHTSREFEGTGIGLAIVQKASHMLGGSVWLESEPGNGSTFYVRVPTH
jgi:PAS domain S-box-containing protein